MINPAAPAPANTNTADPKSDTTKDARQILRKEIRTKWDKFSEQDLAALKGRDDLVTAVVAKYGLEKGQAQRDVDAVLQGRRI